MFELGRKPTEQLV